MSLRLLSPRLLSLLLVSLRSLSLGLLSLSKHRSAEIPAAVLSVINICTDKVALKKQVAVKYLQPLNNQKKHL